jgi:hypothetical protein
LSIRATQRSSNSEQTGLSPPDRVMWALILFLPCQVREREQCVTAKRPPGDGIFNSVDPESRSGK